jgi:uncharacterized membrane protein YeaQ/YmgE (transglycosylase-associated protein family)
MSDRVTAARSSRRTLAWPAAVVVVFAIVGVAGGLLWRSLLDVPHGVVVGHQWFPDPWESGERDAFDATGWYVVIAVVAGLVVGILAAALARGRELWTLAAVLVGSLVAAWLMRAVGLHGAPPDPQAAAKHAADGTRLSGTFGRPGTAAFITWPLAAVLPVGLAFLLLPRRPEVPRENGV